MDYETYDNDSNPSDADYIAFVEWLSALTADELRVAKGDLEKEKQALCRYYRRGEQANLSPAELIDFLAIDTPSILDRAGYSEEEGDALMHISDTLSDEVFIGPRQSL